MRLTIYVVACVIVQALGVFSADEPESDEYDDFMAMARQLVLTVRDHRMHTP